MPTLDYASSNSQVIDSAVLKQFVPIKDLSSENRTQMANKSQVSVLQMGDALVSSEEHRWIVYLLEGRLDLYDANKKSDLVVADDPRANHPLFSENVHHSQAIAQSYCKVVRFDRQLFATLLEHELVTGEELETIEIGEAEAYLFNEIMHAFNVGELKLPSLPEIAIKVKSAATNPNVNVDEISKIIEADPAMAARLIQVVNSPAVQGIETIRTLKSAIVRLGLAATRNLVMSYSVKQLFKTKSDMLQKRMKGLYEHSIEIAAISYAIAKVSKTFQPDQLLLAGLVHDIGVIPVLSYIEDTGFEIKNEQELENIIEKLHGVVGCMVVKHWGFSAEILSVVEFAEDWQRSDSEELDICDIVNIAQLYSMLQHKEVSHLPNINEVPAFKKLFPEKQDPHFSAQVFEHAQEEISEVKRLLRL
jgi:HD-like signal output (HDOD) protein